MRTLVFALVISAAAGCGDNIRPGLVVETKVASSTLTAGDPVGARCFIVDETGETALDPQGNGAAVSWDNPQTGIKGSFVPVGGPFLRSDEICRAFIASVQTQSRPLKLQGTACRPSGGDWAVKDMEPWKGLS